MRTLKKAKKPSKDRNKRAEVVRLKSWHKRATRKRRGLGPHKKKPFLQHGEQDTKYNALKKDGAQIYLAFTRLKPGLNRSTPDGPDRGNPWHKVGHVAFKEGVKPIEAAYLHKRLILEHAPKIIPQFYAYGHGAFEIGVAPNNITEPERVPMLRFDQRPHFTLAGFKGVPDTWASNYGRQKITLQDRWDEVEARRKDWQGLRLKAAISANVKVIN